MGYPEPASNEPDGPSGGFGYGESGGDGASRIALSDAAEATEHVVEGCRRELQFLRRWLRGQEDRPLEDTEETPMQESGAEDVSSPRKQALSIASRLEACANALRNASTPEG